MSPRLLAGRIAWVGSGAITKVAMCEERVDSALDVGNRLDLQHRVLASGTSTWLLSRY